MSTATAPRDDDPTTPETQAAYWKGAYERMAARNHELSASVEDFERRLSLRDTYLSEKGLWHEFATTMLPRPAALAKAEAPHA